MQPIEIWQNIINSEAESSELLFRLKEIYQHNRPYNVEIVLNSYCPNKCVHCIYPTDYHLLYKNLEPNKWEKIFEILYQKLSFRNYIFNGRSINKPYFRIMSFLKKNFPDITMGIVIDGSIKEDNIDELARISPDWVDVSLDGLEPQHDMQRAQSGSFQKTMKILRKLKDNGSFKKISILSCLTTININSIIDMIILLNGEGFPNFFITPVTIVEDYHPSPYLRPTGEQLVAFIDKILNRINSLSDTWVEINVFEAGYALDIAQGKREIFLKSITDYDHLEFMKYVGTNEIHICYYPISLTGVREFIINSNGDVLPPKVVAMGKIPSNLIFGSILNFDNNHGIFDQMFNSSAFKFYLRELKEEIRLLKNLDVMKDLPFRGSG